jgi:acyl-CoA oxidase
MTTAIYDKQSQEYIINTPNDMAMKFWIGGAAKTATMAVVFA